MAADLHQLDDKEIEALVTGRTLRVDESRAAAVVTSYSEAFRPGGIVILRYDRAPVQGRYRIADKTLCIEAVQSPPACRTIHRDRRGNLFQQHLSGDGLEPIVIE